MGDPEQPHASWPAPLVSPCLGGGGHAGAPGTRGAGSPLVSFRRGSMAGTHAPGRRGDLSMPLVSPCRERAHQGPEVVLACPIKKEQPLGQGSSHWALLTFRGPVAFL